jgi:hypothetical protein
MRVDGYDFQIIKFKIYLTRQPPILMSVILSAVRYPQSQLNVNRDKPRCSSSNAKK